MTGFPRLPRSQPVFFDPTRRRWFGFLAVATVASVLLLGPLGVFVAGVFQDPDVEVLLLSRPSVEVAAVPLPEPLRIAGGRPTEIADRAATIRAIPPVPRARPVFTAALMDSPSFVSLPVVKQGRAGRSIQWLPQVASAKGKSPSIEHLAPMPASRSSWLDMAPATKAPAELTTLRSSEAGWGSLILSAISGLFISPVQASEYGYEWQPEIFALDEGGTAASTSLRDNLEDIDVFIPAWLTMTENLAIATRQSAPIAATQALIEGAHDLRLAPMLTCAFRDGCRAGWVPEMLSSPGARKLLVDGLLNHVGAAGMDGVTIALAGSIELQDAPHYLAFAKELYEAAGPADLAVYHRLSMYGSVIDAAALSDHTDAIIVGIRGEGQQQDPGPIVPQARYESYLEQWLAEVPPEKLVIGIPNLALDWKAKAAKAEVLSTAAALERARVAGATVELDPATLNWTFTYEDLQSIRHEVWMLDAVTAFNQLASARPYRPHGFAVDQIGLEDASIWQLLETPAAPPQELLRKILPPRVGHRGAGEVIRLTRSSMDGERDITWSADGTRIEAASVGRFPLAYEIEHWGASDDKVVALTFDDGPDPTYTPEILDVLAAHDVSATFFALGRNMLRHPDIVRRMLAAGHEVGNHTFSHANIASLGAEMLRLELNATQRVFESITGRNMLMFRAPYAADTNAVTAEEYLPLEAVTDLGYLTVNMNIDTKDWWLPNVERIASKAIGGVQEGLGKVVLLHDGGGDRTATVAALPLIIDALRADGYRFVTISELVGQTGEAVMPHAANGGAPAFVLQQAGFSIMRETERALTLLFVLAIGLGIARSALLISMSLLRRRSKPPAAAKVKVGVVVPAHNEEKVIVKTVQSLLQSTCKELEILIVDDGSTDGTYELCQSRFRHCANVSVVTKPNGGKAAALNYGFSLLDVDVVVAIDGDTVLLPEAIENLAAHFADAGIAAVAGNAKVGNRVNLLTRWQALEYITAQNLDRRAFEFVNCISVVPGAIGAWRRRAVLRAGGFTTDTLAEDADLTLRLIRGGYRVAYEERAIALTEAPETTSQFVTQRFRWMFGMLQVAFKHLDALRLRDSRTVGLIAIPNILIFQIVFPLIAPVADLLALGALLDLGLRLGSGSELLNLDETLFLLFTFAAFVMVDALAAAIAFWHEGDEDWRLLLWLVPQRFYYRQLIYIVAIRATLAAVRGSFVGWGVLSRTANVSIAGGPEQVSSRLAR